jgi:ammonium transporter Rh
MGYFYPLYQDVHVMIFVGFGFLMTFVSRYSWSAVGFNFLLSALAIQWSLLTNALFYAAQRGDWSRAHIDVVHLIHADFAAAALMISFGAVLGKASALRE